MLTARRWLIAVLAAAACLPAIPASAQFSFSQNSNFSASEQLRLQLAHAEALRAVEEALAYLQGNATSILQGNNPLFQQHFGQFYVRNRNNPLFGRYSPDQLTARVNYIPTVADTASPTSATFFPNTRWRGDIHPGREAWIHGWLGPQAGLNDIYNENFLNGEFVFVTSTALTRGTGAAGGGFGTTITGMGYPDEPNGLPDFPNPGPDAAIRQVWGYENYTDPTRLEELISTMQQLRNALLSDITIEDPFEGNNEFLIDIILSGNGTFPGVTRGFEQYGNSTSGSSRHQQNLLARALNPNVPPLEWHEELGQAFDEFGNPIPQEDDLFLREQFTTLFLDGGFFGTDELIIGDAALRENQIGSDLFDSDPRTDRQQTRRLADLIIQALAEGMGLGSYNLNTLNGSDLNPSGDVNINAATGEPFPQSMDLDSLTNFIQNASSVQQGGTAGSSTIGPPPGKNAIPSPFGPDILIPRF
jgi:hypothetical protein